VPHQNATPISTLTVVGGSIPSPCILLTVNDLCKAVAPYDSKSDSLSNHVHWMVHCAKMAIDEQLAELDARLQTLQRNIAAKRLARGSIKSAEQHRRQADNLRYSDMLDLRNRASLKLTPAELAITSPANALPKDLRSIYSWRSQRGNPDRKMIM
jgi:uncharacterized membrane protein YgaE (UPF0421/DUF939 family)